MIHAKCGRTTKSGQLQRQRTRLINAIRGHCAEFGVIGGKGDGLSGLLAKLADEGGPVAARQMVAVLADRLTELTQQIGALERQIAARHQGNPMSQLLAGIPSIGPLSAMTMALTVDAQQVTSGRHFAAWLGLTPREHSTGGRQRLGGISREGNERLRQLLVLGATAVSQAACKPGHTPSPWLAELLKRRPRKVVAVALANKMARIVWAMMTSGEAYRRPAAA